MGSNRRKRSTACVLAATIVAGLVMAAFSQPDSGSIQSDEDGQQEKPTLRKAAEHQDLDVIKGRLEELSGDSANRAHEYEKRARVLGRAASMIKQGADHTTVRRFLNEYTSLLAKTGGIPWDERNSVTTPPMPAQPPSADELLEMLSKGPPEDHIPGINPTDLAVTLEILGATFPDQRDQLVEQLKSNPEVARRELQLLLPRVQFLVDMYKEDRELFNLHLAEISATRDAVAQAKAFAGSARMGVPKADLESDRVQLRTLVTRQYDARLRITERRYLEKKEELDKIEAGLEKRRSARGRSIEEQVQMLIDRQIKRLEHKADAAANNPG